MQKITPFLWFKDADRSQRVMQAMLKMDKLRYGSCKKPERAAAAVAEL